MATPWVCGAAPHVREALQQPGQVHRQAIARYDVPAQRQTIKNESDASAEYCSRSPCDDFGGPLTDPRLARRFVKGPFLGEECCEVDLAQARIAILPCPFDGTTTYKKGADRGPEVLLSATPQLEPFDLEIEGYPFEVGVTTLPAVKFENDDPAEAVRRIQAAADHAVQGGKIVLGLGGEHSISIGLTRALRSHRGSFSVLQIDAHADLRDQYEGSPFNHACVMHTIAEDDRDAAIVSVGIRACCEQEVLYARERGIHQFLGHRIARDRGWIEEALSRLKSPLYVTFDLDGLDPSILPSTGTPVPGGLSWFDTLELLQRAGSRFEVIGADINELKPDPVNHHSEFLAAQLLYKMIAYFWWRPQRPQ